MGPRAQRLSLYSRRDAHPSYSARREEGREGKLRLTVNFVVPHVAGVVRNFEASGLTFRSVGNSNPSKYREQETFKGSSITWCDVCMCVDCVWIVCRANAWYVGLDAARVYLSGGFCDFVNI